MILNNFWQKNAKFASDKRRSIVTSIIGLVNNAYQLKCQLSDTIFLGHKIGICII